MSVVVETIEQDGRQILVYDNGMKRDADTGRMLHPPTASLIDSSEKSNAYHRQRQEQKRARILAGAAKHLAKGRKDRMPTDMDVVEAIGESVMQKALDPKNAKQVDAARFVLQEGGLSETQLQQQQPEGNGSTLRVIAALVEIGINRGLLAESAISASNKVRVDEQDGSVIDVPPTATDEGK